MALQDIAKSEITVGFTALATAAFTDMLIVGAHSAFAERWRAYADLDAVAVDFDLDSAMYRAASRAFGQANKPRRVLIGRRDDTDVVAQVDTVTIGTVEAGAVFEVLFEGVTIAEFTADGDDNTASVSASLIEQIEASSAPVTAEEGGLPAEIDVTSEWPGQPFSLTVEGTLTTETSTANVASAEDIVDALNAIVDANAQFYGLCLISRVENDVTDATEWLETRPQIGGFRTKADGVVDPADDTDIASQLGGLNYGKTWLYYHAEPWTLPDVALMANRLAVDPDSRSTTWVYVRLVGIPAQNLTATEQLALEAKSVFYNVDVAGVNITKGGKVIGGEWVDVVTGIDWLNARISESAAEVKITASNNNTKIPYTNDGIAALESTLRKNLDRGIRTDFIASDPAYTIVAPMIENLDAATKASRELPPIEWSAPIAGAIHISNYTGVLNP